MMLLVFTLDDWRYALELSGVERVYRSAAITPLPEAPDIVLGIINIKGAVLPVMNVRRRFRLPEKRLSLDDRMIVARAAERTVLLLVDSIMGVIDCTDGDITAADTVMPGFDFVTGVVRLKDGMVLIHNLSGFLALDEARTLDLALGNLPNE
ncbi:MULTISPECIES: chemotaxis protein CheW [Methylomonas]|uniref:Chemotaxis protein CheW n=1 Tax=Methylomonas koyamae TaxID=702114 RepID=A0A177P4Z9_9GAMM|nr:chemotaxis protein CheW [Methylomonas koyamae]OAI25162.1 chemotaxis protein CheW [Methylomonas koyamae]